jgi:hypothetical protein
VKIKDKLNSVFLLIIAQNILNVYQNRTTMADYKVSDKSCNRINTDVLLHPGEIIADELEARLISQKDFAKSIQLLPLHLKRKAKHLCKNCY